MTFEDFCKELNNSPWMGTICEVGIGVPFQSAYLNHPGASKTILFAHSPYNQMFQDVGSYRSVSREAVHIMASNDYEKCLNNKNFIQHFHLASSGVHKSLNEKGETHGWVGITIKEQNCSESKLFSMPDCLYFHWNCKKVDISRQELGLYLNEYIVWFLRKVLLSHWDNWKDAINELPNSNSLINIDVIHSQHPSSKRAISVEDHLLLVKDDNPLVYHDYIFQRPVDFFRKYQVCYRGSFNPPTIAHNKIGENALWEISIDNARKGKINFVDLAHRITMITDLSHPILITSGSSKFVDLHKHLLKYGIEKMDYIVGMDTFNAIVNPKYIDIDDDEFFKDFDKNNPNHTGSFSVCNRQDLQVNENQFTNRIDWKLKEISTSILNIMNISSSEVREGNYDLLIPLTLKYILKHNLYGNIIKSSMSYDIFSHIYSAKVNGKVEILNIPEDNSGNVSIGYFKLGKYHKEDGPARQDFKNDKLIYSAWYINGLYHRDDGPAIMWSDGSKLWFLNNEGYSQEEWFDKLTPEQKEKVLWNMDNW